MVFTLWSSAGSHKHSWVTECCSTTAARIKCAITPPPCLSSRQKKQYPTQPPRAVSPGRRTQSSSDTSNHFRSCRQGRALQSDGAAPAYAPCTTKTAADCAPGQNPCSKISCISHPALCKGLCWLAAVLPQSPQQLAKLFPIIPFSIHFFFFFLPWCHYTLRKRKP